MTDTKTPSPSDAELWDLIPDAWTMHVETAPGTKAVVLCNVEDFARAVLARWGQPQAVAGGEPVAWRSAVLDLIDDCPGLSLEQDRWLSRRVKELDFPSAPPPQAVREPLSDEQVRRWWERDNGLEDCNLCKLDDFMKAVRAVEAAHGITKGGQHGAP